MEHLCFKCEHSRLRKIGEFKETNCPYFPAVKQQVDGNVTACEKFECGDWEDRDWKWITFGHKDGKLQAYKDEVQK